MSGRTRPELSGISVVIAAYTMDRWDDIAAGVEALSQQTVAPVETLLVIDHNDELLLRARESFPGVRVLDNRRTKGASGARNTGIAEAKGDVVAFLDDDARPDPDWVEMLLDAYDDEDVLAVGGSAYPGWPASGRPDHLPPELDWIVGCTYQGQPTERADVRNLWACNMSVRRTAFDLAGGFNEDIGRARELPLGTEETELCIRIRRRVPGARIVLEPRARVRHRVTEARVTWDYLRLRSQAEGVSKGTMVRIVGAGDGTADERTYVRKVLPRGLVRELRRGVRGDTAGYRAAAGIVTCLATTTWWYGRTWLELGRRSASA